MGKNDNNSNDKDNSVEEMANEQLEKIKELEDLFGDRYISSDDVTRIVDVEEIDSKLNKEENKKLDDKTSEINFDSKESTQTKIEENTEYNVAFLNNSEKSNEEDVEMPRSMKKRKRSKKDMTKDNRKNKGKKGKKGKKKLSKFRIFLRVFVILSLLLVLTGIGVVLAYIYGVFGNEKALTKEDLIIENQNSTVYDRSGKLVATLSDDEKREIVTLSDMPEYLPKMYIAIEDERFYKHSGVDYKRTFGATAQYLFRGGDSDYGASTLTQQLIKNITEDDERSWKRKVREITRALQVEKEISKEQVLELYLNVIFIGGDNIHGVALGSDYYFNKSQKDLTMAESAFLAGINHMPNAYNPFNFFEEDLDEKEAKKIDDDSSIAKKDKKKAKIEKLKEENRKLIENRTMTVLDKIYKDLKWISKDDYEEAVKELEKGLKFKQGGKSKSTLKYSYITDAAIDEVLGMIQKEKEITRELAELQLYNGGYKIYTTQNSGMQKLVEDNMKDDYYILKSNRTKGAHSQASATIIDHKTGQVVAAVGGLGEEVLMTKGDWNRTTRTLRQLGSSMKPIGVAAPGLESGTLTAATVYDDVSYGGYNNFGHGFRGYTNIRKGIEVSNNIIFLKAVAEMGEEVSADYLKSVGFKIVEDDLNIASLALGGLTYGVSSTQVAGAYAAMANGGEFIEPTFVLKVENADGKTVMKPQQKKERVLSPQNAFIMQKMMTSTVTGAEGTGNYASVSGFETGVKTGTTNDDYDRWLCGFTPKLTCAVWYGFDVAETIYWGGINPAGLIWRDNMRAIHNKFYDEGARFEEPEGIVQVAVCRDSGLKPSKFCSKDPRGSRVYSEYFAAGTTPSETCNHHEEVEVCKVSGLLPTKHCLEKEKKVFLKKDNRLAAGDLKYTAPTKKCNKCTEAGNTDKKNADEVNKLIAALPSISSLTLGDEGSVNAANAKYTALNTKARALVSNVNKTKLDNALARIKKLKEEAEDEENDGGNNGDDNGDDNGNQTDPDPDPDPDVDPPNEP